MSDSSAIVDVGVIHGRFQIFHNDHLKYLLAGKELCRHLVIGITNPDPVLTRMDYTNPERSTLLANPLTYYERYVMLRKVMRENGLAPDEYSIVPLPINLPDLYKYYVPLEALFFLSIYDEWGRQKLRFFNSLGLKTRVLWERPQEQKGLTSHAIRTAIMEEKPWQHLVPTPVPALIEQWQIRERLLSLRQKARND